MHCTGICQSLPPAGSGPGSCIIPSNSVPAPFVSIHGDKRLLEHGSYLALLNVTTCHHEPGRAPHAPVCPKLHGRRFKCLSCSPDVCWKGVGLAVNALWGHVGHCPCERLTLQADTNWIRP